MQIVINDIFFHFELPDSWEDELGIRGIPKEKYSKDMSLRTNPNFIHLVKKQLAEAPHNCWFALVEIPDDVSTWKIITYDEDDSGEIVVYVKDGEIFEGDVIDAPAFHMVSYA